MIIADLELSTQMKDQNIAAILLFTHAFLLQRLKLIIKSKFSVPDSIAIEWVCLKAKGSEFEFHQHC